MYRTAMKKLCSISALFACFLPCSLCVAAPANDLRDKVLPFMQKHCMRCHQGTNARGELDLSRYAKVADVTRDFRRWSHVVEFIRKAEMPPKGSKQPTLDERNTVVAAITRILAAEAKKHAGDPGVVLPRRLTRVEYDNAIRDLTGVDIKPTKSFPPDPAAGEGFRNTGEALSMSPALLRKYLQAAQQVSHHLVLKTDGITFAPFPVTSYNERKKLTEQAILDFYRRHEVRIADYIEAAWRYRHRGPAERELTIGNWAGRNNLSARYLTRVWKTLNDAITGSGYLKRLGQLWKAIPPPSRSNQTPRELAELSRYIDFCRKTLCHREERLIRSNAGNWPISHLDFRAKTAAMRDKFDSRNLSSRALIQFERLRGKRRRRNADGKRSLTIRIEPAAGQGRGSFVLLHRPLFSRSNRLPRNRREESKNAVVTLREVLEKHAPVLAKKLAFGKHPKGDKIDADSFVVQAPATIEIPLDAKLLTSLDGKHLLVECELDARHSREGCVRIEHSNAFANKRRATGGSQLLVHGDSKLAKELAESAKVICDTFPNRFFYVDNKRGLAAGFHLVEGFFRDDQPLVEKVLEKEDLKRLNRLWEELHFVTNSYETLIRGFVWFERSERHVLHDKRFDFLRAEDPRLVKEELLGKFERVYLPKMGVKLKGDTLEPEKPSARYTMIHGFFQQIRKGLARRNALLKTAEQRGLLQLEAFARRAYRRPLQAKEAKALRAIYASFRKRGQDVETAMRGVLTAVLMSPDFCYQFTRTPKQAKTALLSDHDLASRLSFFLWSTLPDDTLLAAARRDELSSDKQLLQQTRRMLKSPKIDSFAREFFGQWLRYRDYLKNDPIIATTFPRYSDSLRQAMFEEPTRLATWLIQNDRPITDLLNSDTTFVNGVLAKHYGGDIEKQYRARVKEWTTDRTKRGLPIPAKPDESWHRVTGLRKAGRGGLFGMGVILTTNSAGERTSPVKRGFWTVHHLLGQHFPPPPADVPELPGNEKSSKDSIRKLVKAHTAHQKCAMCHKHFDSLGFAMEGFDPIGRSREKDLAGRRVDTKVVFPNGTSSTGVAGLITYVEKNRQRDFVSTFCRKFLGYALGRSVILSDQSLLDDMEKELENNGYRFSAVFETVVRSPQFRKQRGRNYASANR